MAAIFRRGRRLGGQLRRLALGRAWRWPGPGRATRRQDQPGKDRGIPQVQGQVVKGGWRDEAVREALDLCLSCKGCKHDCPVQVDMATYKAEFLSHYYEGRLRPRYAYASGLIYWWSRLAAHIPAVANFFTQTPG